MMKSNPRWLAVFASLIVLFLSLAVVSPTFAQPDPTDPDVSDPFTDDPPSDDPDPNTFDPDELLPETEIVGEQDTDIPPAFEPAPGAGTIFGSELGAFDAPGSGFYLNSQAIQQFSYGNINQVLRQVPGVYVRDEAGFGNFPNISLRGVDTTRSAKVTLMEDGVLTAPAPYAAPSAYYFPNIDRMAAVEIFKGHSQIRYGPHTTGGAINFVSTLIPEELTVLTRLTFAQFNESRMYAMIGNTVDTDRGRIGYLLEGYFRESDGFRTIDEAPDFRFNDNERTGFKRQEPMIKMFWEPYTEIYQRWEAKAGYTDFAADETYLGLSEADVINTPLRRYNSSRFDNIDTHHVRSYLRYTLGDLEEDGCSVVLTGYYNRFARNWFKLNDLRNIDTDGDGVGDGVNMSLSAALVDGIGLQVLQGQRVGGLRYRNNNREYYAYGYDSVFTKIVCGMAAEHELSAGVRFHTDQIHPFQDNDTFTQNANGAIVAIADGAPGSQRNRIQETSSLAAYVSDDIRIGSWTISPGIRFEHLNLNTVDFLAGTPGAKATLDMTGGGVGVLYDANERLQWLGGFHRGFSPPNPRGVINDGLEEEEALASEFGFRYHAPEHHFGMQVIGFYTHFNNLIVIDNVGGTGTGANENFGKVYSGGIEYFAQYDVGRDNDWGFSSPVHVSMTWTDARILEGGSADPESIFSRAFQGARIPYIPEWQTNFGVGFHFENWGVDFAGTAVSESFGSANNQISPFQAGGVPDARFGVIDSYFVADISSYLQVSDNWKIFGGVQNVFDNLYVTSRQPHGPRVGLPLYGYVGVQGKY